MENLENLGMGKVGEMFRKFRRVYFGKDCVSFNFISEWSQRPACRRVLPCVHCTGERNEWKSPGISQHLDDGIYFYLCVYDEYR